jgi:3-oxoacyl-[acyl-carrier-protein] synthase II
MGPSNTITCADASSHLAIGEAFRTIQRGKADLAICGGAESKLNPMGMMRQHLLHRLVETKNDVPADAVRPFDADAAGSAIGEGGGLLILEEYEHAKQRAAKIYAELVGFAASQDTYRVTDPEPSGHSYGKAVENALRDAKLSPADVDLLIPHGLGIPAHDRAEFKGLQQALGDELKRIALAPLKAQIGNLAAGSGVDAAAAVMALHTATVPPAVNTRKPLDGVAINVAAEARGMPLDVAVASVYSLGGQNAAIVFKKAS